MKMKLFIILVFPIISNAEFIQESGNELKEAFFENLRALPILLNDPGLSEISKEFIEKQIENYKSLNLNRQRNDGRKKRNSDDLNSFSVEFSPLFQIPGKNTIYASLTEHDKNKYALVLEDFGQTLSIYKSNNQIFVKEISHPVENGVKLDAYALEASLLIVVAEYKNISKDIQKKTKIYEWKFTKELNILQVIDVPYATDVKIWKYDTNIYMCITSYKNENNKYETKTPIYQWLGSYFDVIQEIDTSGAKSVTPIWIRDTNYLAISNSRRNSGNTKIYSEIFKFDYDSETYKPYQRIMTKNCQDIKHFLIMKSQEHFLIVANSNSKDDTVEMNNIKTIIYKLVDNYFIPFQSLSTSGIIQWEYGYDDNSFVLFGLNSMGQILLLNYDQWHFVEQISNDIPNVEGIKSIKVDKYQEKLVLVVANSKTDIQNIYEIKIGDNNGLESKYQKMLGWCYQKLDVLKLPKRVKRQVLDDNDNPDEIKSILTTLETYNLQIDQAEQKWNKSQDHENADITAKTVEIIGDAAINHVITNEINQQNIENLMDNVINIQENTVLTTPVHFVTIDVGKFQVEEINGRPVSDLVYKNKALQVDRLVVNGDGDFIQNVNVLGSINNISMQTNKILLNNIDQDFDTMKANNLNINNLNTEFFNKLNMQDKERHSRSKDEILEKLNNLTVQNLVIEGFINDVDVPTLYKYSLRKEGNQNISKMYIFDNITAKNLQLNGLLTNKNVSDIVSITTGFYDIPKNILMSNDVHIKNLVVENYLNNIPVKEQKLDVLLKKSDTVQYIKSPKEFENLNMLNLIRLQGKIRNKELAEKNILVAVHDKIELNEDVFLFGDVTVEHLLTCDDVKSTKSPQGLWHVHREGLKVKDTSIPIHLSFSQPFQVDDIFADEINGIDPNTWLVNGIKQPQIIKGWKQFNGDVRITGSTNAFKINNINVVDLESNILMQHGDQIISGKHVVKELVGENNINYDNLTFGSNNWKDVITISEPQTINGTTTFTQSLHCNNINAKKMEVGGTINKNNFTSIAQDVVKKNGTRTIEGHKTFNKLKAKEVTIDSLEDVFTSVADEHNLKINENTKFPAEISIKNIIFTDKFNGIEGEEFSKMDVERDDGYYINDYHEFDSMIIYKNAYIKSNKINDVEIRHIVEDSVKTNEPHEFRNVKFGESLIVNGTLELDGQIENFDLDNVINANSDDVQVIMDEKIFENILIVTGDIYINGQLNGINMESICSIVNHDGSMNLDVKGKTIETKASILLR